ncbi:MAG: M20 family peptidase [Gemmatimonadales bacterium]
MKKALKKMRTVFGLIGFLVLCLAAVLLFRTVRFQSVQGGSEEQVVIAVDEREAALRFAATLTFPTISLEDPAQVDSAAFRELHEYLEVTYPLVHSNLERQVVSDLSLLYTWRGRDPSLNPVVLMGHLDVVPVIPGTETDWTQPPFGGVIADGYIWGRGAMDDKSSVLAILEAVEALIRDGHQPARTIYLAFGHDEEVGGGYGARVIAEQLSASHHDGLAFVLDEGGAIADGLMPGIDGPVAIIGISEKGGVRLELKVEGEGGHSSIPPEHTNIGILASAITRLEEDQFPATLDGAALSMFRHIGPEMEVLPRLMFANLWLFKPLVERELVTNPQTAAMVRTTTAATMIEGGVKSNVLPTNATAVVNLRILPGETVESVTERVRQIIDDDRVQVSGTGRDPSPVSDPESPAFKMLARTLRQVILDDDLVVSPYLVVGGTDARYYTGLSNNVYRFLPARIDESDIARAHGTNERLSVESFATSVRYFYQLIRNSDGL